MQLRIKKRTVSLKKQIEYGRNILSTRSSIRRLYHDYNNKYCKLQKDDWRLIHRCRDILLSGNTQAIARIIGWLEVRGGSVLPLGNISYLRMRAMTAFTLVTQWPLLRRESLFLRKIFPGFLLEKSAKNHATANAFGCPDPSSSPRFDPTRGRNIGSKWLDAVS